MPLYKIIKMWFLPPGMFILILLLLSVYTGYYIFNKQNRLENIRLLRPMKVVCGVCLFLALLIYGLSIDAVAQRLMHNLEYQYVRSEQKVDAIVLITGDFEWSRDNAAAQLYKKYKVPIVLSPRIDYVYKRLINMGVPRDKIIIEEKAFNTKENALFTLSIVKKNGFKKIYLVSSANHMARSMMNFKNIYKQNSIEVIPYPAGFYTTKDYKKKSLEFVPNIESFQISCRWWHENLGMLELLINEKLD